MSSGSPVLRDSRGISVVLSWSPFTRRVFVDVANEVNSDTFRIVVDGADALDAFNHPYADLEAA
jgi:hypothetical protein